MHQAGDRNKIGFRSLRKRLHFITLIGARLQISGTCLEDIQRIVPPSSLPLTLMLAPSSQSKPFRASLHSSNWQFRGGFDRHICLACPYVEQAVISTGFPNSPARADGHGKLLNRMKCDGETFARDSYEAENSMISTESVNLRSFQTG